MPEHLRPGNVEQFGHYLAGLIDGDGSFGNYVATISFYCLDASLAYYIKKRLGYGYVRKVKSKNAYVLTISKREGLETLLNLINGKLRTQAKLEAIFNNILNKYVKPLTLNKTFHINNSKDLDNHWLAGFIDADGSFQIKVLNRITPSGITRTEIRLKLQIDQKDSLLLDLIKNKFGGYLGYRKTQNTYYYETTSFGSARKVINYLNNYHLLSSKHINYLKWRKVYLLVQEKKHLTPEGQTKIIKLKSSMNSYSNETLDLEKL